VILAVDLRLLLNVLEPTSSPYCLHPGGRSRIALQTSSCIHCGVCLRATMSTSTSHHAQLVYC
jgi:ferredoxin